MQHALAIEDMSCFVVHRDPEAIKEVRVLKVNELDLKDQRVHRDPEAIKAIMVYQVIKDGMELKAMLLDHGVQLVHQGILVILVEKVLMELIEAIKDPEDTLVG